MITSSRKALTVAFCGAIIVLSFYLREEMVSRTELPNPLRRDAGQYFSYAYNLRHHEVYSLNPAGISNPGLPLEPDAYRPPGYPLFLSFFIPQVFSARTIFSILIAQAMVSTLTVVIAWRLYSGFLGAGWAGAGAVLTALSPHLVSMNIYVLSETLFCFALVSTGGVMAALAKHPRLLIALTLGGSLGAANLVRPSLQFFPIVLSGLIAWQFRFRHGTKLAWVMMLGFFLVLAPWHIRNLAFVERWSDPKLQVDFLHHGIYPGFMYEDRKESYGFAYRFDPRSPDISESNASVLYEIINRFQNEPLKYLNWYLFQKPIFFWSWNNIPGDGDVFVYPVARTPYWEDDIFKISHRFMGILHQPMVFLGWLGCILVWLPTAKKYLTLAGLSVVRYFALILIYFTLMHMVGAPFPRYSVPLRPFLYGMSLIPMTWLWQWFRYRRCGAHRNVGS